MKNLIIGIAVLTVIFGSYFYFGNNTSKTPEQEEKAIEETGKKIVQEMGIESLTKKVQSGEITEEEMEKQMMKNLANSKTFKNEFEKQKAYIPKYINLTKSFKSCIEGADTKSQAKNCSEKVEREAKAMGLDTDENDREDWKDWSPSKKTKLLSELDTALKEMNGMSDCYNSSSDMLEVMKCSEKVR